MTRVHALLLAITLAIVLPYVTHYFATSSLYDALFLHLGRLGGKFMKWKGPSGEPGIRYNYSTPEAWAAHPDVVDWGDTVPPYSNITETPENELVADLFFIYPTGYFGPQWNAPAHSHPIFDPLGWFNDVIADSTTAVHASAFNNLAAIYSPRYRQATAWAFMMEDQEGRQLSAKAMELAYRDVLNAFEVFLATRKHKPFILAAHSQGSFLAARLLRDHVSRNKTIRDSFVVAYLVGASLKVSDPGFDVCQKPESTKCWVGYNAFDKDGGDPSQFVLQYLRGDRVNETVCVNPLTWDTEIMETRNLMAKSRPFLKPWDMVMAIIRRITGQDKILNLHSPLEFNAWNWAKCQDGVLMVENGGKSGYATTGIFPGANYHGGESSMFWASVRENANVRVKIAMKDVGGWFY